MPAIEPTISKMRSPTESEIVQALIPTITQGEFTTNLPSVQKEVDDYFALNQRLKYYAVLDEVIRKGWELTTKEIKEIIGFNPKGDPYSYGSYKFKPVGKAGRSKIWICYKDQLEFNTGGEGLNLPQGFN